jgi:hypothetical protein
MTGQPQQAFVDPRVDYRHEQLMTEVAQHLDGRGPRRHRVRSFFTRSRRLVDAVVGTLQPTRPTVDRGAPTVFIRNSCHN